LVAAIRDGDDEAFGILYLRYRDQLAGFIRRNMSDASRAEDVLHEAFASALNSLRSTRRPIIFKPWIYRIVQNACIDHHRRSSKANVVGLDGEDVTYGDPVASGAIPQESSAAAERREELEMLRKALAGLPESQEDVLVMRELEGLPYDRIATRTGLSSSAVESVLFRARRTLRDEFERVSSGSRCEEIQSSLPAVADADSGIKRRKLIRHMHACSGCRRAAYAMGYAELAQESAEYRSLRSRVAALLPPIPFLAGGPAKVAAVGVAAVLAVGGGVAAERALDDDPAKNATPASSASGADDPSGASSQAGSSGGDNREARRGDSKSNRRDSSSGASTDTQQGASSAPAGSSVGADRSGAPGVGKSGSGRSGPLGGVDTPAGNPGEQAGQLLDDTTQQLNQTLGQTQQQLQQQTQQLQGQVEGTVGGVGNNVQGVLPNGSTP
jgi:RNA polymerase sigma-70 factor (ECF subfamily)